MPHGVLGGEAQGSTVSLLWERGTVPGVNVTARVKVPCKPMHTNTNKKTVNKKRGCTATRECFALMRLTNIFQLVDFCGLNEKI